MPYKITVTRLANDTSASSLRFQMNDTIVSSPQYPAEDTVIYEETVTDLDLPALKLVLSNPPPKRKHTRREKA